MNSLELILGLDPQVTDIPHRRIITSSTGGDSMYGKAGLWIGGTLRASDTTFLVIWNSSPLI